MTVLRHVVVPRWANDELQARSLLWRVVEMAFVPKVWTPAAFLMMRDGLPPSLLRHNYLFSTIRRRWTWTCFGTQTRATPTWLCGFSRYSAEFGADVGRRGFGNGGYGAFGTREIGVRG